MITPRRLFLASLAAVPLVAWAVTSEPARMFAYLDGDNVRISAPQLNFLSGRPAARLRDGATIAFVAQVTVSTAPGAVMPVARSAARFALSYDIWEEKFSVTRFGDRPGDRRSASHLSERGAESWCIDNLSLSRSSLPVGKSLWFQLDLRAEDPRDSVGVVGDPGINITRLIEVFSRPARGSQQRWMLSAGPYNIDGMRHSDPSRTDPAPVAPPKFDIRLDRKGPLG